MAQTENQAGRKSRKVGALASRFLRTGDQAATSFLEESVKKEMRKEAETDSVQEAAAVKVIQKEAITAGKAGDATAAENREGTAQTENQAGRKSRKVGALASRFLRTSDKEKKESEKVAVNESAQEKSGGRSRKVGALLSRFHVGTGRNKVEEANQAEKGVGWFSRKPANEEGGKTTTAAEDKKKECKDCCARTRNADACEEDDEDCKRTAPQRKQQCNKRCNTGGMDGGQGNETDCFKK